LLSLDWAAVVLASWLLPLLGFNLWPQTYLASELFWALPILALLPRFFAETRPGSRRRRAFAITVAIILVAGSLLDLAFGRFILAFGPGPYLGFLAGIPYEEFIFYLLGPIAMLLVYFWADQHFLRAMAPEAARRSLKPQGLLSLSARRLGLGLALLAGGVAAKALLQGEGSWLPWYYTFLLATAYLPVLLFWPSVQGLVNWPALSLAVLYTLVTSVIWEASLALPHAWWGYQGRAMLGLWVQAWQPHPLPIEAVSVWVLAPFACIFFFEIIRRLHYHPGSSLAAKLGGPR
jgi:lycopene cyclase domain-containing protein